MKNVFENAFFQLLIVYAVAVVLIALGLVGRLALQFQIAALFVALLGLFVSLERKDSASRKMTLASLFVALILFVVLRMIPYFRSGVPLGYDPGIYRYVMLHGLANLDKWVVLSAEPGFMYLMLFYQWFFSASALLTCVFIGFCAFLGIAVYLCASAYHNRTAGIFAVLLYVFSVVQYKAYWFMYYRNIIGITLLLLACYALKKREVDSKFEWLFVLFGVFLGLVHRPTFYLFGLSYFFYSFVSPWKRTYYDLRVLRKNVILGAIIAALVGVGYLGTYWPAISGLVEPVLTGFVQPGEASGTFIDFFNFQFSTLAYLPLSLLGLFYLIRKKDFSIIVFWAIISAVIVYFQFFFFNRFIIFLDLAFVLLGGIGFALVFATGKKLAWVALGILLIAGLIFVSQEAMDSEALVSVAELDMIKSLSETPNGSYVMSTSSYYSPWIQGYSERKTIAPGLFDYDSHTRVEWSEFWSTNDTDYVKGFMSNYSRPLYVYIGPHQVNTVSKFTGCFLPWKSGYGGVIYEYSC